MSSPRFEEVVIAAERRGRVRKSSNYYATPCPAHVGSGLNLHIMKGNDGGAILKCHSRGCGYWAILEAFGFGKEAPLQTPVNNQGSAPAPREGGRWAFKLLDGSMVEHVRFNHWDGNKSFAWYRNGKSGLDGYRAEDLPLYGIDELQAGPWILVEGEKACDALRNAGYNAVATIAGADVTPSDTALAPLLNYPGCRWPDNDDKGRSHMTAVGERLSALGNDDVRSIDWVDAPSKGDAFDAVAAGVNIKALIDSAPAPQTRFDAAVSRLGLKSVADWIDQPEQPIEWVIDGLLAKESLTMLCAFPKAGKSVFARCMAYAVATGTPFLGSGTHQGMVIYAALEEMESQVRRAFRAMGVTKETPLLMKFGRANEHFMDDLRTCIEELKPTVVIIDTFVRIPRKKNPESSDYLGNSELLQPLVYLAHETKTAVVPLYHSTKAGKSAEGYEAISAVMSNAGIVGSVDQLISIVVQSDDTRGFQSYGRLEPVPVTLYSYDRETEALAVLGTKEEVTNQATRESIMDACDLMEWITNADLKKNVSHGGTAVAKAIKDLYEEGQLQRQGTGRSGAPYEYRRVRSLSSVLTLGTGQGTDIETEGDEAEVWTVI